MVKQPYIMPLSGGGAAVVANPALTGNESRLSGLEINGTKYANPEEIFVATYGTTTYAQAAAALAADKLVICNASEDDSYYFAPIASYAPGSLLFTGSNPYSVTIITLSSSTGWSMQTYQYAQEELYWVSMLDVSFANIKTAYQNNKYCCIHVDGFVYTLSYLDENVAVFNAIGLLDGTTPAIGQIEIYDDDTYSENTINVLPANLGSSNAGKVLVIDSDGNIIPAEHFEVFPVTYNQTTFTEIANAVTAQKLPVMIYQYDCYVICSIDAMMGADFVCAKAGSIQQCSCSVVNVWSHSSFLPVNSDQGIANAGKFLVVGNDGIVAPVTMAQWTGGSY